MKKKLSVVLAVLMVLFLVSCTIVTYAPEREITPDGVWCYAPLFERLKPIDFDPYEGDTGKVFSQVPYVSEWNGAFSGSSTDYGLVLSYVIDPGPPVVSAPMIFIGTSSFIGEVNGVSGGLEMDTMGEVDASGEWNGTWVITSGTGELEGLQGEGIFWGPGWLPPDGGSDECPEGMGPVYYSGSTHFESEQLVRNAWTDLIGSSPEKITMLDVQVDLSMLQKVPAKVQSVALN